MVSTSRNNSVATGFSPDFSVCEHSVLQLVLQCRRLLPRAPVVLYFDGMSEAKRERDPALAAAFDRKVQRVRRTFVDVDGGDVSTTKRTQSQS